MCTHALSNLPRARDWPQHLYLYASSFPADISDFGLLRCTYDVFRQTRGHFFFFLIPIYIFGRVCCNLCLYSCRWTLSRVRVFFFLCMYVCVYLSGVYEYVCCQCLGPRYGVRTGEVLFSSLRGCECALFSSFIFSLSLFFFLPDSFFNTRLFFAQPPRPSSSALCTACRLATPASTYA